MPVRVNVWADRHEITCLVCLAPVELAVDLDQAAHTCAAGVTAPRSTTEHVDRPE